MTNQKTSIQANLRDYDEVYASFDWRKEEQELAGLPGGGGLNIAHEAVDRHAGSERGDAIAFRWLRKDNSVRDCSYAELRNLTSRFANVLTALGLQKGDRIFTLAGRVPELYIAALGTLKTGAVFCPLFSVFGPEPVFQRLSRGEVTVLVTSKTLFDKKVRQVREKLPSLRFVLLIDAAEHESESVLSMPLLMHEASEHFDIPPTSPEDPALLHFTSGTTGMPKGAVHVHKAVLTHYVTGKYVLDFHVNDVFWCTADPGWVTGTSYGIISPLVNGVTSIIDEREFDAARWYSILEEQKVTVWYTAPTAIRRLMRMDVHSRTQHHFEHLRLILSVGEPLPPDAVVWGQQTFGVPVLDNWWQTETGGIMISNFAALDVKPGSMGKALPGIEAGIALLTDGEITLLEEPESQGHLVLKTGFPSLFRTYLHEEERYRKCFSDNWYLTGDLAKRDADGYFWFIGRADDIIKTSGHMVGPFEVESVLMEHPAVAEAAVIGKPNAAIGELVKAFIVIKNGRSHSEELRLDIIGHARKKMGPALAPKEIEFVHDLPKTRSGKILRRLLKARELGLPEGDLSTLEKP